MYWDGAGPINARMATAIYIPDPEAFTHADPFSAMIAEDTLVLAGQLAEAVDILVQCHARNVFPSDEFLEYVDDLTERIDLLQPDRMVHAA